ncbi:sterol desaturase family protein [Pelagibius sp. Alg239-R121]|uniref:sterol desaturase family protein n=1 Tax=Pelagibius sp. Alg239-R121 TaxID=2993448 RepID=UPI0024A63CBA|nr:sterol desaturase family protein [Pelagibius sp. Alg239-R121]
MEDLQASILTWKGGVVLVWFAAFFIAERWKPAAREQPEPLAHEDARPLGAWSRVGRNLGLWVANVGLSPLVVVPLTLWASEQALDWRPLWWSGPAGLLLDLMILDFLIYWWHRANHEIRFLWRFHEIHHLDRFLDTSSALRFHFGEVLLSACARAAVIILLGIPFFSVIIFEILVLLSALFHHSNLRIGADTERLLSRLIITPSIHWVHHHAVRRDTDSNYGTIFSFWDRLFGSSSKTERWSDMPIGVERTEERRFLGLLIRPFSVRQAPPAAENQL